jgi:DNA polymerase-3 subunit gamma/tau
MARKETVKKGGSNGAEGDEPAAGKPAAPPPAKPYVVLARKYRPQTFDDLIGQAAMVQTLTNAFAQGRIAQGYMLTGVRGIGKTTTARILARALNYERSVPGEPVIDRPTIDIRIPGRHCAEIMESRHPDVIEMDAASNTGIDNIREIIESARYKPILARHKVFIIDEVHMLSKGAFNALLKTLEEPPEHVKFIFATTEIRKVPVTVLSRCQRFDLRRVDIPELVQHFRRIAEAEGAGADDDALALIARAAGGSVRDGLSILDQAIASCATGSGAEAKSHVAAPAVRAMLGLADRGRIFDLLEHVLRGDAKTALGALAALHHDGAEPSQVLADLAEAVHSVSRLKATGGDGAEDLLSADERRRVAALAERMSMPLLARAWQMLVKGIDEAARAPDQLAAAEMALIRLAYTADLPSPDEVIRMLGGGVQSAGRAPPPSAGRSAEPRGPLNAAPAATPSAAAPVATEGAAPDFAPWDDDPDAAAETTAENAADELGLDDPAEGASPVAGPFPLRSFPDLIDLVGRRRDAKLRVHLEEHVSLVRFDGSAGSIDLFLLPGAPSELANELREKLNAWTGRRWIVMLSRQRGEPPVGEVRREREARELEDLKRHPAVAAVLAEFPEARIAAVKPLDAPARDDETGTG